MATTGEDDDGAPDGEALEWPLLQADVLERRQYQVDLARAALDGHTLVCLPTGLGKTAVSLLVTAHRLHGAGGKSLLLAPTKPLVTQHAEFYRAALSIPDDDIVVFTGEVSPDDRATQWDDARVVVATPQVVENDLLGTRISLADVTHLTFDECHRATGEYAYNYIAERYHEDATEPLVTGMSASPGDDAEAIHGVCANLGIANVEVMTEADADVAAHTHETSVEWEHVDLPETVEEIRDALNDVIRDRMEGLKELGVTKSTDPSVAESEIQRIQGQLRELMNNDQSEGYQGMSLLAEVRKLRTAVTYVETQSVEALRRYLDRQQEAARSSGASKADQRLVSEPKVRRAKRLAREYDDIHPKFRRTRMLVAETLGIRDGERVIVFTESRDTAETLTAFLEDHFAVERFVGQSDTDGSDGMTQTQQQDTLERFRGGEFDVLVSTSVAEEGLDVPEVDLVLFYEPVPTAIRSIQRKGRTGRQTTGRVVVLIAEGTRDEAYFWKSRRDEERMEEQLRALKDVAGDLEASLHEQVDLAGVEPAGEGGEDEPGDGDPGGGQAGLDAFEEARTGGGDADADAAEAAGDSGVVAEASPSADAVEIVIDQRELDSSIARDLSRRDGLVTRLETLAVGDYVVSDRVVVERKTVSDFLDTLLGGDRSLFEQVGDAARHYARPVVVVEGEDLYGERNVHPSAIHGALGSLAVDFGASVLRTDDADETADLLAAIARREQDEGDREVSVHGEKQSRTLDEQQVYVVASIAEVGPVIARSLLAHFGSVQAVMIADGDELREAEGVGEVTAERIREVVASEYEGA
jgi:ERCC4-related helicase/ERCC4-type nuclease